MSDKKGPEFLDEEFDWDAALDDWEKKSFLSEPAKPVAAASEKAAKAEKSATDKTPPLATIDAEAPVKVDAPEADALASDDLFGDLDLPEVGSPAADALEPLLEGDGADASAAPPGEAPSPNEVPTAPPPASPDPDARALAELSPGAVRPPPPPSEIDVAIEVTASEPVLPPLPPSSPAVASAEDEDDALSLSETVEHEAHRPPAPTIDFEVDPADLERDEPAEDGRAPSEAPASESRVLLAPSVRTTDPDEETTLIHAARAETIAAVAAQFAAAQAAAGAVEVQRGPEMDADEERRLLAELAELEGLEGLSDEDEDEAEPPSAHREFDDEVDTGVYEPSLPDGRIAPSRPAPAAAEARHGTLPHPSMPPARPPSLPPSSVPAAPRVPSLESLTDAEELDRIEAPSASDSEAPRRTGHPPAVSSIAPPPLPHRAFDGERPAEQWLEGEARDAMEARAAWLEEEARASRDRIATARGLLLVSELRAMLGDLDEAARLAVEARNAWPQLALPHRQARGLETADDPKAALESYDAAVRSAVTPEAKLHELLMAADAARVEDVADDVLRKRWDQAWRASANDPRVIVGRASLAVARQETGSSALRVPEGPENAPIAEAVASAMRMRDMTLPGAGAAAKEPTETLRKLRQALADNKVALAAKQALDLRGIPELAGAATWLAAALATATRASRPEAVETLGRLHEPAAVRLRAALGLELGDDSIVSAALLETRAFSAEERIALHLLLGAKTEAVHADLGTLGDDAGPLAAAAAAMAKGDATRTAGLDRSRRAVLLGRRLARKAAAGALEEVTLARAEDEPEETRALKLEVAFRAGRFDALADDLRDWEGGARPSDRFMASGLVGERTGDRARAEDAYRRATEAEPSNETALRAFAALDPEAELAPRLRAMAESLTGPRAALTAIEATVRGRGLEDAEKAALLELAHGAAPELPFASFLAERVARQNGAILEVLRWVRERRAATTDPLEGALDAVREALLVADGDPGLAAERLEEAHRARPGDVALRDLYERLAVEPPADGATWREARAAEATGTTKHRWLLEAAHAYERLGDREGALRAARAAHATSAETATATPLSRVVLERAEILAGDVSRLADELLGLAKSSDDPIARREAFERLADLDANGRGDPASALLWHRSILEDAPEHLPSLRYVEQALLSAGRDDEYEPFASSIATALAAAPGGEAAAHAGLGARLRMRRGDWAQTAELATLAATRDAPPIWSLRLANSHARLAGNSLGELEVTLALLERTTRPPEVASLLLRAGHAAALLGRTAEANELLERATTEDPSDIVAWARLAEVRLAAGDFKGAAHAHESVARASEVPEHRLASWYQAAQLWSGDAEDDERAISAFEEAARIDITHADVFVRLSALYAKRGAQTELASLLERRSATARTPEERLELDVERGRVLVAVGDPEGAKRALEAALDASPDHVSALKAYADVCSETDDWEGAEQSWVQLARLLEDPEEQAVVYGRLGELYSDRKLNLDRAELSFQEVLKRRPADKGTVGKLIAIHQRKGNVAKALDLQKDLLAAAKEPAERREAYLQRAALFENVAKEPRKAEQTLETARRELHGDVVILRALAEFYTRHKQLPAVHILLDRAAADARRAFAAGRFVPQMFETMAVVYELRGKKDAAAVVDASLAAFSGRPIRIAGAEARAGDPRLDELLAPDVVIPALRALLARTGDALDAAAPYDPRSVRATALSSSAGGAVMTAATTLASGMGLTGLQVLVSPDIGTTCIPVSSTPPTILVGEPLLSAPNPLGQIFVVARALKLVQARAAAFARVPAKDLAILFAAYLHVFNPSWKPQGIAPPVLAEATKRLQPALQKRIDQDVGLMALEVAGAVGTQTTTLGASVLAWANRAALLAVGDPSAALDAVAWMQGLAEAPKEPAARAAWIAKTREAIELLGFSVSDGYTEARARVGLAAAKS